MRRTSVALAIALICNCAAAGTLDVEKTIERLKDLLKAAGADSGEGESAAFVVEGEVDDPYRWVSWPRTNERLGATWRGPMPEHTIAIAHTHPIGMPQPSRKDIELAMRLRLSLIVVSRTRIYVVDAAGVVTLFASNGWQKRHNPAGRD